VASNKAFIEKKQRHQHEQGRLILERHFKMAEAAIENVQICFSFHFCRDETIKNFREMEVSVREPQFIAQILASFSYVPTLNIVPASWPQKLSNLSIQHVISIFGHKYHMIFALPFGMT